MKKSLLYTMLACLVFSVQNAGTLYVNSSYAAQFIDPTVVGLLYTVAASLALVGTHTLPLLISPKSAQRILVLLIALLALTVFAISSVTSPIMFALLFVWYFAATTFIYYCFDVLIESASDDASTGSIRGKYLTGLNVGYMIGPLAAGFALDRYGYTGLYVAAGMVMLLVIAIIALSPKTITPVIPTPRESLRSYISFFKNRDLRGVFATNFLLQFFFSWMVIYTPIYLHEHLNIEWKIIGIMFTVMLSAFVLFEYAFGKLADKIGEKEIMVSGLVLAGIATPAIILTHSAVPAILAGILFLTRVGASALEVSTESYFFKHINAGQSRTLSIFRSTYPLAYITAPLIASAIIDNQPIAYLFYILAGIMLVGIIAPLTIRDTK